MIFMLWGVSLFVIGAMGFFVTRKNPPITPMALEPMLLGISINFTVFSMYFDDIVGQAIALFILTVAASETALGLSLALVYHRIRGTISVSGISMLKG